MKNVSRSGDLIDLQAQLARKVITVRAAHRKVTTATRIPDQVAATVTLKVDLQGAIVATILRVDIDLEKVIRAAHHQDPKEAVDTIITTEIDQNTDEETNMKIESGIVRKAGAEEAKTSHRAREVYFVHQVDITAEAADMMLWISVLRRHHGQRD
ncbi:unnamed protein product [Aphanomyces euteiches]